MRHGRSLPAVTLLAVVTLGACSGEPERPEGLSSSATSAPTTSLTGRAEQVAEIVEANTGSGLVPGIVVVLADDTGEESVARGVSDLESETPMRVDDRFRIASITKSMTAAVVLQLAQDAVLGLDDTVETWLPGLLAHGDEITVRQLLGHLSGLEEADDSGFVGRHGVTDSQYVAQVADAPLEAPPGDHFAYRNINYVLLGMVVEAATGHPVRTELQRRLFDPLGMTTARLATEGHPGPGLVRSYEGLRDVSDVDLYWAGPAGSVTGTAADVSRFFNGLFGGAVVPNSALAEMTAVRDVDAVTGYDGYGLGLAEIQTDCGTALGHDGRQPGFWSDAWTDPATGRSVVVLVNASGRSVVGTVSAVREAALCG